VSNRTPIVSNRTPIIYDWKCNFTST